MKRNISSKFCAVYIVMAILTIYGVAYAQTITVKTTADNGAGSLRQAITDASDGDMIEFDPILSGKAIVVGNFVFRNLIINGLGSNKLTLYGHIITEGNIALSGVTITGGNDYFGGGIENYGKLRLNDVAISENHASEQGGGIFNWDGAEIVISNSVIKGNSVVAGSDGAGIFNLGNITIVNSSIIENVGLGPYGMGCNKYGFGVGIMNYGGSVSITNSTISRNKVKTQGPYNEVCFFGGGIANNGIMNILNSTISDNFAGDGGGIENLGGEITLTHTTVSNNSERGVENNYGVFILKNSLISNNKTYYSSSDCKGKFTSLGHNIIVNPLNCVIEGEAVSNADPKLGTLSYNGGPTLTHALLPGSPAIGAGDSKYCPLLDQRSVYRRSYEGYCDIGAFEYLSSHHGCMINTVGDYDNFHIGDPSDISPKSSNAAHLLYDVIGSSHGNPPADLDDRGYNRPVGITHYVSVPQYANITSAKVSFRVKSDYSFDNDVIFYKGTGCFFGGEDNSEDNPIILLKYLTDDFYSEQRLSIDLTQVPVKLYYGGCDPYSWSVTPDQRLSLIPLLKQEGKLDLVFTDDTAVDDSTLSVCYSCSIGDLDGDCDVDMNDLNIIKANLNKFASACTECDLDKDGKITVLDAKKLMNMCNCPKCLCP